MRLPGHMVTYDVPRVAAGEARPFDPPETGKIAVKVISHYGDEVLKVYEVQE